MTSSLQRIAVVGAGSWGTAFAKVLADAGREVTLYARRESLARAITEHRTNPDYLPDIELPDTVTATADLEIALDGAQAVALAVPSQSMRENLVVVRDLLPATGPVLSLAKGIEVGTGMRMSQLIGHVGRVATDRIVVLTGPNLAREIAQGQPTTTVLASSRRATAETVQRAALTAYFRPYTIVDVIGAEIAGTGKNVVALAYGIASGLGLGGNTGASLVTRGLAELTRLGQALGALPATFAGLAGVGDLVATCASPLSRNRSLGARIGGGLSLADALAAGDGQVAEGVASCRSLRDLALRHGIDMPIIEGVYRVCYQHQGPEEMIRPLMEGPVGAE